jgi:hypothetical protein
MQAQLEHTLQVVVREGLKGNHLLFAAQDLAAAFAAQDDATDGPLEVDASVSRELASAGLQLARSPNVEEARLLIAGLSAPCRAALARLYFRFLARCAGARGNAN